MLKLAKSSYRFEDITMPAISNKNASHVTFAAHLREEMDIGQKMAADPTNANLPDLALRITSLHSTWFMRTCRVCQNKFREGDLVRLCPRCNQAYHDDSQFNLSCWQKHFSNGKICTEGGVDRFSKQPITPCAYQWNGRLPDTPNTPTSAEASPSPQTVNQFVAGLRLAWRPFGKREIHKVQIGDPIISRKCPWCRLHIRVGDWVVACPCGCGTYFHEDIFRHLTCWNEWNGVEGHKHCPNTGHTYEQDEPT